MPVIAAAGDRSQTEARSRASSIRSSAGLFVVDVEEPLTDGVDHRLHPGVQMELLEDVADVILDRVLGDVELLADLAIALALGDQLEHLELALRERGGRELLLLLGPAGERR